MEGNTYNSNFYMDGEAAFMDGLAIDQNPYGFGDDAADAWHAGWLAAYSIANVGAGTLAQVSNA